MPTDRVGHVRLVGASNMPASSKRGSANQNAPLSYGHRVTIEGNRSIVTDHFSGRAQPNHVRGDGRQHDLPSAGQANLTSTKLTVAGLT